MPRNSIASSRFKTYQSLAGIPCGDYFVNFPEYGDTDSSIILSDTLTSSSNIGGGVMFGSGYDFNSDGVLLGASGSINISSVVSAADKAKLVKGGCFTVWVDKGYADYVASGQYESLFFCWNGANNAHLNTIKLNGDSKTGVRFGTNANPAQKARMYQTGKDDLVRFDLSWTNTEGILFIDNYPVAQGAVAPLTLDVFDNIHIGGQNGKGPQTARMKNFMLSTKPILMPKGPKTVVMLGHSFAANGDYPEGANSYIQGDTVQTDSSGEARTCARIHRDLHSYGIGFKYGKIRNYGVGGAAVTGLASQITSAISAVTTIDIAIIQIGLNEVTAGTGDFNTDYPTWQADIQAEIDTILANGADQVYLCNVTSPVHDSTYGGQAYLDRVDAANLVIDAVAAANTEVIKVDLFNLLNGHNALAADFATNDRHPSDQGYNKIGTLLSSRVFENSYNR